MIMFMYTYNRRLRILKRIFRLLERSKSLSSDLVDFGLYDEYLDVINHIELLFPVEFKKPHGHGI